MSTPLAESVRRARALARERDKLAEAIAGRWAVALRGQPVSARELEEFWAGLVEDIVRGVLKRPGRWEAEAVREAATELIARVRDRVEQALAGSGNG